MALEIDDIERFPHSAKLAAYAGLVPSTYSSGGKTYHGHLLRMTNKWLKWALVEAVWTSIRHSAYCRLFFDDRKRRKGPNTAIVALARRLSEIVWHVLKEKRVYEERPCRPQMGLPHKKVAPATLTKN
ncbi:transposase [Candidatus Manganitrophus noduliformans]|uniref:transposase n=1 Tax=Candidatus Manganitrophus noduliformans TaxID=2606439 RepID=UPI002A4E2B18|nr:transposase [Candidatus Manganitrophus noduliformans]